MPNRQIREGCRSSPTLDALSPEAERMFWRLITVADDFGLFDARPVVMLVDCFKLMAHKITPEQVLSWFNEMVQVGLVMAYVVDGKPYGCILKWGQRRRATWPKFPSPCPNDGHTPDNCPSLDRHLLPEVRGTRNEVRGTRNEVGLGGHATAQHADADFIESLKKDDTYSGIDIDKELGKCQNWMKVNVPGRELTRRRFINWLNKTDVPIKSQQRTQQRGLFQR